MGKISRDCDKDTKLPVEKVGAHAAFWVKWAKAGPNRASIDSSKKRIMFMHYQMTVLLV